MKKRLIRFSPADEERKRNLRQCFFYKPYAPQGRVYKQRDYCNATVPLFYDSYEKIGFNAAASASFCACASARSFPKVVK